jgi:hypothetical protein
VTELVPPEAADDDDCSAVLSQPPRPASQPWPPPPLLAELEALVTAEDSDGGSTVLPQPAIANASSSTMCRSSITEERSQVG